MSRGDADSDFDRRIRELNRLLPPDRDRSAIETHSLAQRGAEIKAMSDAYLGEDYDQSKIARVIELQARLRTAQERLGELLDEGHINREKYLEMFTTCLEDVFERCERALGPRDFEILFGCSREEATGFIEPEAFLGQTRHW